MSVRVRMGKGGFRCTRQDDMKNIANQKQVWGESRYVEESKILEIII